MNPRSFRSLAREIARQKIQSKEKRIDLWIYSIQSRPNSSIKKNKREIVISERMTLVVELCLTVSNEDIITDNDGDGNDSILDSRYWRLYGTSATVKNNKMTTTTPRATKKRKRERRSEFDSKPAPTVAPPCEFSVSVSRQPRLIVEADEAITGDIDNMDHDSDNENINSDCNSRSYTLYDGK